MIPSKNRHDPGLLGRQPRQRDMAGHDRLTFGPALHQLHERKIVREVLGGEAGLATADVTLSEARSSVDGPVFSDRLSAEPYLDPSGR